MPAVQKNFQNFKYTDDNAVIWTKRGEDGGPAAAIDGHAAGTGAPTWRDSARMHARRVIYQDATTFRTVSCIIYTAAAFTAIALGSTVAVSVEGETATVAYTAIKKASEKQPGRGASRQLADHA
jgi:hypothetical protein